MHDMVNNLMRTRLQGTLAGLTDVAPIFTVWKCPKCRKEQMDIVGLDAMSDIKLSEIARKLSKEPFSLIKGSKYCDCSSSSHNELQLIYSMFCVYNSRDKFDFQIHVTYDSPPNQVSLEVYVVSQQGQASKLSHEQRIKLIGL